jgi:vancomycin resistance protein YoaR
MSRTKKFIIIAVSVAVLLAGSIVGVAFAAGNGDDSGAKPPDVNTLERVCAIYEQNTGVAIDQTALKDAFAQARSEIQKEWEQARMQDMVKQGKITQEQADQFLNWWESKPNVPFGFGFPGHGRFPGMGGPCAPPPPPPAE